MIIITKRTYPCIYQVVLIRGGATVPFQTPSALWVVVPLSSKHLLPTWVTGVVSLHTCVIHLVPLWVTGVVSLHTRVIHIVPMWVSAVVSLHMCEIHLLPLWVTVFLLIYSHLTLDVEENVLDHSYMYKILVFVQFN